ncbi:hypothetical protein A167_01701 [Alcanivorax sp. S71-1-4]|nr:hypothetical protein A167_01701 [Alcanivorax sp. S71-1-4]
MSFLLSACGGSSSSDRALPPAPAVDRGALISMTYRGEFEQAEIDAGSWYAVSGPAQCNVHLYELIYQSIGVQGEPAQLSAALLLPDAGGCPGPYPLLAEGHGTEPNRDYSMTAIGATNTRVGFFAAHGYAVVATDYLGLGKSDYDFHPYLHADSEASAMIDALRAARHAGEALEVEYSGKVMVMGYSQGGHTAMATQREIEANHLDEFYLVATAPMAGPYALSQTFLNSWFGRTAGEVNNLAAHLAAFTMVSYQNVYGNIYQSPSDVFKEPYASMVEDLFPGPMSLWDMLMAGTLPPADQLSLFRQDAFSADFIANPDNAFRQALVRNDLLNWTPVSPMLLCGSSGDSIVEFQNALTARDVFAARGVDVPAIDVAGQVPPGADGLTHHSGYGAPLCFRVVRDMLFDPAR